MILTIAVIVYAIGALIGTRILAGHLAWKWKSQFVDRPERLDWFAATSFGLLGGLFWLPLLAFRTAGRIRLPAVGAERRGRELEAERRRQATLARTAQLEREIAADDEE